MLSSLFSHRLRSLSLAASLVAAAGAVHAEYLWLQRNGEAVEARFGEIGRPARPVTVLAAPRAFMADGEDLPVSPEAERVVVAVPAGVDLRAAARRVGDDGALHLYQARWGRAETKAVNDLELVPTAPNGNIFKLLWKGNKVAATQVNVDTSEGWRRVLRPAADGTITLPTPFPGLYVLEVTAKVNGAATVDGKKYDDVRHTATLSFEVPR